MKILIACEFSGVVREAFRLKGHDAWSCDLLPAEDGSQYHYQCDIREIWNMDFDLWGFHPPCTYLCSSGIHWNSRGRGWEKTNEAIEFVRFLMTKDKPWYLENPIGLISSRIRKPDQIIQPWMFGCGETKATCLWLNRLPKLIPTKIVEGRNNRIFMMPGSKEQSKKRSITYKGIAEAMSIQWNKIL